MKTRAPGVKTEHAKIVRTEGGAVFTIKAVTVDPSPPQVWFAVDGRMHVLSLSDAYALARALTDAADEAAR